MQMFEKEKGVIGGIMNCRVVRPAPETELLTDLNVNSLDSAEFVCVLDAAPEIEAAGKDAGRYARIKETVGHLESDA